MLKRNIQEKEVSVKYLQFWAIWEYKIYKQHQTLLEKTYLNNSWNT